MTVHTSFKTTFAVPMTCDGCIKDVTGAVNKLDGISNVQCDLANQMVSVEGTTAPSKIVSAIQETGRDAILRGSGSSDESAVCILETHASGVKNKIRGLVRMVQVSPKMTVVDLSVRGVSPGQYRATVRECGDISQGPLSTGGVWQEAAPGGIERGEFGPIMVGESGAASVFVERPVQVWEIIGRSLVLTQQREGELSKESGDTLVGVIARSAGVWDNDKTVCSCTGKNVWQERTEQLGRGML